MILILKSRVVEFLQNRPGQKIYCQMTLPLGYLKTSRMNVAENKNAQQPPRFRSDNETCIDYTTSR